MKKTMTRISAYLMSVIIAISTFALYHTQEVHASAFGSTWEYWSQGSSEYEPMRLGVVTLLEMRSKEI